MHRTAETSLNNQTHGMHRYFLAALAMFILPVSGLAIDIYVPSLPAVSQYFAVDKSMAQLSITTYMAGLGLMQFFGGSISDSFGRRLPFLVSMTFFIIATLLIPHSSTISQLLLLRFIQGSAVAVSVVPMRAIFADLFHGNEYYKMITYMTMIWSIGPVIAPAIGGYLQHYLGWQYNFYFLGVYSLISLILNTIYLPDTSPHHHPFQLMAILKRYRGILTHPIFLISLLMNTLLYSICILFAVIASFVIETQLHYTSVEFGHVALLTGFAWFIGTMSNRFLMDIPLMKRFYVSFSAMFVVALVSLMAAFIMPMNIYLLVISTLLLLMLGGNVFPDNFARVMELFPEASGSANALYSGCVFLLTALISTLGAVLKSSTLIPVMLTYTILPLLLLLLVLVEKRVKR